MRPELQAKRDKLKAAATDLIQDYMADYDRLREEIMALESALAQKKGEQAMIDDTIRQLSRSAEALDRE